MKKLLTFLSLAVMLASCQPGDSKGPGTPIGFQFVCDATTFASTCTTSNTRSLTWIAAGDDGNSGRAIQYDARWGFEAMTPESFVGAFEFITEPLPQRAGMREIWFLPRMIPGTELSFGIRSYDEVATPSQVVGTPLVTLDYLRTPVENPSAQPGFGAAIELLGDINGHYYNDIAVSAPDAVEPVSGNATGAVYVYLNLSDSYLVTTNNGFIVPAANIAPAAVIYGEAIGDQFGAAVSGEGDFNGDGMPDMAVGAPATGKVYIFFGGSAGNANFSVMDVNPSSPVELYAADADIVIQGPAAGFGASIALLGEINAVAGGEMLIGSPGEAKAYLFYGGLVAGNSITGTAPILDDMTAAGTADWTIVGPAGSDFGATVARVSNIDGGVEDMAIASPGLDLVYVFFGGGDSPDQAFDLTLPGPIVHDLTAGAAIDLLILGEAGSRFGASINARRDHSGGGYATLFIGAPGLDKVYAFYGGPSGVLSFPIPTGDEIHDAVIDGADLTFTGVPGTNFGESLTARADINGDARPDILIGAPDESDGVIVPGAVYQFNDTYGMAKDRTVADADYTIWGPTDLGRFGASVIDAGEIVGQPAILDMGLFDDLIVGAPGVDSVFAEY